ncbi:hypothetical protein SRHO_G00124610 [Serrasalmus rhombeus]
MFFQWISCAAIWVVGLVGDTLFRSSKAHPAAMLGGVIWATGFLSGSAFVPMLYIKHHATSNSSMFAGSSQNDLDYCFAQSSGIFIASTVYFTMYCAVMKNRPRIYPRAILPGFLTGVMWGVGTYCWLLANRLLGPVVTFPIVTAGYGLVAALWGIVVFKEVKGLGNVLLFVFASCVVLSGSLLTAFSKI